ncbi:S8 family serine peptidase [Schlesneria paludicola]|uniref:S8 family serine peptidase n=1 Tax=Schlesneria paludicola TaxID=360056 RepID=UPI0002EE853E|nr:S8 family serine peptidase [Schlesneria paludicola]
MPDSDVSLLMRFPKTSTTGFAVASGSQLAAMGITLEPLFETQGPSISAKALGASPTAVHEWYVARPIGTAGRNPWDVAHEVMSRAAGTNLALGSAPDIIEPDLLQQWGWEVPKHDVGLAAVAQSCDFVDQDPNLPFQPGHFAWHLEEAFSQLKKARERAGTAPGNRTIRIAHLDTGYDASHSAIASTKLNRDLQRNFIDSDRPNDARDLGVSGVLKNPGHGLATLTLLAGGGFKFNQSGYSFDGVLGGAPNADIVPIRVGNSVVQLTTSAVAKGISYAVDLCQTDSTRVHVISMSMGGVASAAWADAVNKAYEAGIIFVAAAGNNYSAGAFGFPTHQIVYPARFRRVLAACGVMADRTPYYGLKLGTMQGNWGPEGAMATALSAFTPNTSWAKWGCANTVLMSGAGTSSATPQIAAAAALYLQQYANDLFDSSKYPEAWMRVEAVRQALFRSADTSADGGRRDKLGNGILRANDALSIAPPAASALHKTATDFAGFPFLNVLSSTALGPSQQDGMLRLEATQLLHQWGTPELPNPLEQAVNDPDRRASDVPESERKAFLEAIAQHPRASQKLQERAKQVLSGMGSTVSQKPSSPTDGGQTFPKPISEDRGEKFLPPKPTCRKLRGYAVDPSLCSRLETANIAQITFEVPWEKLRPGPVGEYLEVIDIDPASRTFYEPVNLESPVILAQDGLPPSEGVPQFHQQMVYAVSSLTIRNFETALGRKALWRPGPPPPGANAKDDSNFIGQLRIYPHALREANAYYSPNKIALLFGYFDSVNVDETNSNEASMLPGGRIFTCLSHDIVAHETTHALLDGMHRRFLLPSNLDVLAFHEGFADCVAMLQHFTFPDLVADQIRVTRGAIDFEKNILTQLAIQFGFATGQRSALRDATGNTENGKWLLKKPSPTDYQTEKEPHGRGRILVSAVFDAFLSIYRRRTSDLLRLATGGSGVLQEGAIHPDLVRRLAEEASKAAQHVLTMCIRALDYCPPTDITFGEYLRAIITADSDVVDDDRFNYRISFVEAFQRRGIFPPDVRTLSVGSLKWRSIEEETLQPSEWLKDRVRDLRRVSMKTLYACSRKEIFTIERTMRMDIHRTLETHFHNSDGIGLSDAQLLGIDPEKSFEVHTARIAFRPRPDGGISPQVLIGLIQSTKKPVDPSDPFGPDMNFEGGCSLVADLYAGELKYCIRKRLNGATRLADQQSLASREFSLLRSTYFGKRALSQSNGENEPFALVHRNQ